MPKTITELLQDIQADATSLAEKAYSFGLTQTDHEKLHVSTQAFVGITDRGTPDANVQEGETYTINPGYYHGGTIKGVAGGGNYSLQAKTGIVPSLESQTITADSGYYGLSSVQVNPIPSSYKNISGVTATAADVLATKVFVNSTGNVAGTMPNNGAVSKVLDTTTTEYTVPAGYHNGSGTVSVVLETKTVTPSATVQNSTPTAGKVLSKVTVNTDPDLVAANIKDGVDIFGVAGTFTAATTVSSGQAAASENEILAGYSAWVDGAEVKGNIPTNTSLSVSGATVTAAAGYYADDVSATVATGALGTPTVNTSTGVVTAAVSTAGYLAAGTSKTLTLSTQAAKTVTPSTSSQTAVAANKYTTGEVTVAAIPAKFVDSSTVDAGASNVLYGKKAVVNTGPGKWAVATGTMPNNGTLNTVLATGDSTGENSSYTLSSGYYSGGTITDGAAAIWTALNAI